ncbi:MAG: CRISPR-associated endoribonuclease Cas6 [Cyanobacteria bacterium P01_G01_bin.19]
MPYSLILNLTPQAPIYPGYARGRHLHALFLNLVSYVDLELGNFLHEQKTNKAFTISPLQILDTRLKLSKAKPIDKKARLQFEHQKAIAPHTPCWWRISLLDESLFGKLTQLWLNINPDKPWHLGNAELKIGNILGTPQSEQPWANAIPYDRLYEEASEKKRKFTFSLATPTTFSKQKSDNPLPIPESIFGSLGRRWNSYSKVQIPLEKLPLDRLYPSYFNIRTEVANDYNQSKLIGCVGDISYHYRGDENSQQLKYLNTLANFALYSGMGKKTTMGMGMVRRIN